MTTKLRTRTRPRVRFYCPGCGEVRSTKGVARPWVPPHQTGSPTAPRGHGQRDCAGGHPDPVEDRAP